MKTTKFYSILSLLIIAITLNSCVQDGDFTLPNVTVVEPNIEALSSISAVKEALKQEYTNNNHKLLYTFPINKTSPTYFAGYVVSSAATGNFYKKIIVQDKPENPTVGIEIVVNKSSLHETFEIGRKIYVKLDGLTVSYDDGERNIDPTNNIAGKYILGNLEGDRVRPIPSTSIKTQIIRSATVESITPTTIAISDVTGTHINTFIKIINTQFEKSELEKTFAGSSSDSFDGIRTIFECDTEATIKLQTSTFASFKSNILPTGKGSINAVLTKDYKAEKIVLIVNTPSDISFTDSNRCDPQVLDCGGDSVGGSTVLLDENFQSYSRNSTTFTGWRNVNVNGGNTLYKLKSYRGAKYAEIGAYRTNESPLEVWLISPQINLDNTTDEKLTFKTKAHHDKGATLKVFVSSDYSGDVATATWLQVDATLGRALSGTYGNFVDSGSINLSCLSGNIVVAFKYKGDSNGITTSMQIDDVKITGN